MSWIVTVGAVVSICSGVDIVAIDCNPVAGAKIDVDQEGTVRVYALQKAAIDQALARINEIVEEAEPGKTYNGTVKKIVDFGAFVEILPGTEGLLHISEISHERIKNVTDVLTENENIEVKVLAVDRGRIKLSRKALLKKSE